MQPPHHSPILSCSVHARYGLVLWLCVQTGDLQAAFESEPAQVLAAVESSDPEVAEPVPEAGLTDTQDSVQASNAEAIDDGDAAATTLEAEGALSIDNNVDASEPKNDAADENNATDSAEAGDEDEEDVNDEWTVSPLVLIPISIIAHILALLTSVWSVEFHCFVGFAKVRT